MRVPTSFKNGRLSLLILIVVFCVSSVALAQESNSASLELKKSPEREPGYCEWVKGATDSERAILMYPELYSTLGPVSSGDEETGDESSIFNQMALRLTVGLQYRFINLYRGIMMGHRADAECRRYLAQSDLQAAVSIGKDWGRKDALEAKLAIVQKAMPEAETQLDLLYKQLDENLATVDELYAVQLKVDALRQIINQTQLELERLATMPQAPKEKLEDIVRRYNQMDDLIEKRESQIRRAKAWAVDIKGGYDQSFGNEKDYPLFAQVKLSFNFGGIAQPSADSRAASGRRRWRSHSVETLETRVIQMQSQLKALAKAEHKRLDEINMLADELSERLKTLKDIDTEKSKRFRNLLWMDYVSMNAERVYLKTHLAELQDYVMRTTTRIP